MPVLTLDKRKEMKNRIYFTLITLCLLIPGAFAQTDFNVESITVINLGDGRLLHRTVSDNLPIQGELRIIDGRRSEYKLVEFTNGLYDGKYQHFKHNSLTEEGAYKEGRKHGEFTEYFSDGTTPKARKAYKEGKSDGMWITYYTNGEVEKEKGYKEGKEHGVERSYDYETGELVTEMNFKDGKKDGPQKKRMFSNWGTFTVTSNFVDGKQEGAHTEIYETGEKKKEENYKNGKLEGEAKEYYVQPKGQLKSVYNYTNGRKNGKFVEYKDDGTIREEGIYENGTKKQ